VATKTGFKAKAWRGDKSHNYSGLFGADVKAPDFKSKESRENFL